MLKRGSLGRRLLLSAAIFIALALAGAAVVIGYALHHFVQGQIDQRLDMQAVFLSSTLRSDTDGILGLTAAADGPPFDRPRGGWYWQVNGPRNTLRSASLEGADLALPNIAGRPPPPPPPPDGHKPPHPRSGLSPADGPGPYGNALHFRILKAEAGGIPVTVVVSSPRAAVLGPLRSAMITLALSLGVLALALVLAVILQVRLGLRPLERLRSSLADVRAGRSESVPADQPLEIQPLVIELNGLLAQNATNLERARRHVANLAHGLKTPLATLAIALSERGRQSTDDLFPLVALMERRIRHHLGRARHAALSGPTRTQTPIATRIADLGDVLKKIHADKRISLTLDVPYEFAVACEQQDFDEMAGNLLENAFKWARSKVGVWARADEDRWVTLMIEDDGPGLAPEQISQALRPGERLDESISGFGFGLPIARELAELYGGGLDLAVAQPSGLRVSLKLPSAARI